MKPTIENDEDRGTIAGIGKGVIEATGRTARLQRQQAVEELSLAAARAAAP